MTGSLRRVGESVGRAVMEQVGRAASRVQETSPLPADLLESDDAYLVVFDAPGAQASDVQVRYRDGAVLVRVDRFRELREEFEMRFPGRGLSLDGRVRLPDDALVDPNHATATLRANGTLEVEIPKRSDDSVVIDADEAQADDDAVEVEDGDDAEESDEE